MTTRLQSNRKHPPRRLFWPAVCCGLSCIAAVGWLTFIPRSHLAAAQQKSAPEKKSAAGRPAAKKPATKNPAAEPKPTPLEQRPYRVRVSVAFAGSTSLMPAFRRGVLDELRQLIVRGFGRMWRAEVVENVWIAPSSGVGLRRLTADELLERFPGAKPAQITGFDKVFYLAIEAHGPRLRISGREWDARSQQIGPTETVATSRRREVAHRAFALLPRLFHPTLQVDSFDGWTVEMRIQGAVFPAGDERLRQVRVGDVILPYFRYADRPKIVRRIQTFDWTYILVDTVS
ncbi:MAG: hypothetical protein ACE5KM_05855, partial [Planctomycetaceae bacterium]